MSPEDTSERQTRWMLDGDPPEPQTAPALNAPKRTVEAVKDGRMTSAETHTGTDPLGRAVGPLEDHTKVKQVRDDDGKLVTPTRKGTERKARKRATAAALRDAERTAEQGTSDPIDKTV